MVSGGRGDASVTVPSLTRVQMACLLCTSEYLQRYVTLRGGGHVYITSAVIHYALTKMYRPRFNETV